MQIRQINRIQHKFHLHSIYLCVNSTASRQIRNITSKPCRNTLRVERGPLPQRVYNCGVSSLAKSAV